MKNCLLIFFIVLSYFTSSFAQARKPKSYALVIGISKYENEAITPLNFADRDAQAFENFCTSDQGLGIPMENVKILVNEEASRTKIMKGLDWLKEVAKKDDKVYFYYAGHGDMESETVKQGSLLAYDSRSINYSGSTITMGELNNILNLLSVGRNAKVFLIADACHSGNLAGSDFNGSNLVNLDLMRLINKNEVRITSCGEDQKSYEDTTWGGGRGAFSYFLIEGMSGEADGLGIGGNKDGNITIKEIKTFLDEKVPKNVANVLTKIQNPVVKYDTIKNSTTILNSFKSSAQTESFALHILSNNELSTNSGFKSIQEKSLNEVEQEVIESVSEKVEGKIGFKSVSDKSIDFKSLSTQPTSEIIDILLETLIKKKKYSKELLTSEETKYWVAETLLDKVKHIIDLYLSGDEAELEKRRYYSQVDKPYDQYPYMLAIAIKLLPKDHLLIPSIKMQKEYLTGLVYRLKIPFTKDYLVLIDAAMIHQQKALTLDSTAAYIHNEIGILHFYKKSIDLARYHYEKARDIAPLWALPYSNLANLYLSTEEEIKDDIKAKYYVDEAIKKQENLQNPYITDGSIYMNADNMLYAEEQFQKAIKINDRHFLPFDKLGDLHLKLQDYQTSEIYLYEGALRKIGLINDSLDIAALPIKPSLTKNELDNDDRIPMLINEKDIFGHFAIAKDYFDQREYAIAQEWFEHVIEMDADNPLAYHYIGQTAYHFKDFAKAELYFKKALDFYLDDEDFKKHVEEMKGLYTELPDDFYLAEQKYKDSHFDIYDPAIYLARTYEKWGYFALAAAQYKECLNLDSLNKIAYQMLWNMYKNRKELESAESVMYMFGQTYPDDLDRVLADYYEWGLEIFNEDVQKTEYYAYKYGLLMYEIVKESPETYFANFERSFPNSDEKFTDYEVKSEIVIDRVNKFISDDIYSPHVVVDVSWIEPRSIVNPVFTGIDMLEKVKSISIDKNIKADVFAKLGDLYLYSKKYEKALENYESSLNIKEDNLYIRSMVAKSADQLFLYKKAFGYLTILEQSNNLKYEDAIILAKYYMKAGNRDDAVSLYDKISDALLDLKEEIEKDVIKLYLRFEEYPKVIELIKQHLENDTTDMNLEYMLARAHAGLNNPDEAIKHLQNAEKLGFDLGFVYKNDSIFDGFRTSRKGWADMQEKMDGFITLKMASVKDNAK